MSYAAVIVAAVALGLAAFALYVAIVARSRAIDAQARTARHQREHRLGAEDTGTRRHRAAEAPSTEQIAAQRPDPETALATATPPESGPYARLRQSRDQQETVDPAALPATEEHPAPRALPSLPPPGRIDR